MFELKIKGNPMVYSSDKLELKVRGNKTTVYDEDALQNIIAKNEHDEMEVLVKGKYRKVFNIYFKSLQWFWVAEGFDD